MRKLLQRLHPASIRRSLAERRELRSAVLNANWLVVGRCGYLLTGFVVGIWVTRYLGPARYGLWNYCIAFAALFSVLSSLGLNLIVPRNLVQDPGRALETLGGAALIKLIGAVIQLGATAAAIVALRADAPEYVRFVIITSLGYFCSVFDVIDYWFQARVEAKWVVLSNLAATVLVAGAKVAMVIVGAPLEAFVWTVAAGMLVNMIGLLLAYRRRAGVWFTAWKVRAEPLRALLRDAWPLSLSAFAVVIYMKIDQVMIGEMMTEEALGQYSVAVRISELWYFLPMTISGSVFPGLLKLREKDRGLYRERLQTLFDSFFWFSAIVALAVTFLARWIVVLLYGPAFAGAGQVLALHIWSGVFVFAGIASSRHLVAENLTRISLYRTLAGGIANVALNLVLIPRLGIMGAAWATLISYAISGWLANAVFRQTRDVFVMQLNSLNPASLKRYLA